MQAITIAVGKNGINFFAQHYLSATLSNLLAQLAPPNKTIGVPNFNYSSGQDWWEYSNVSIGLSNGSLRNFSAAFQNVIQGVSQDGKNTPVFTLNFNANNFSAFYNWLENFHYKHHYVEMDGKIPVWKVAEGDSSNPYSYQPLMNLTAAIIVQFLYENSNWDVTVYGTSADGKVTQDNIPSNSILNGQDNSCAGSHIDGATQQAIDAIDFATPVNNLIKGIIKTIPGSGNLGSGIIYDFSLGDSGLKFPNNDGIQMGVKGGASYNGTAFSGVTPPSLPMPVPPADTDSHHLNMYVSNYEVDALHWAFWKAGKLNVVVNPADLHDPGALKVATYVNLEKSLKPFQAFAMQAQISPTAAPVTTFQLVWEFTAAALSTLQKQLPPNVYNLLSGLQGNAYTSKSALEQDLTGATIPNSYFPAIEKATQAMGMVVTSNLNFDLIIENQQPNPPDIKFSLARTDILTKLGLGIGGNNAQTLQYDFLNVNFNATFISSTVPGFQGATFGNIVFPIAGEPRYAEVLAEMGKTGAPLPIMADFQFDFTSAQVSIQESYVSILASVLYKNK